jgi:hypothetical protein
VWPEKAPTDDGNTGNSVALTPFSVTMGSSLTGGVEFSNKSGSADIAVTIDDLTIQ